MVKFRLIFTLFFLLFLKLNVYSQTDTSSIEEREYLILAVESMPEYKGGIKGLRKFIKMNIKYPKSAVSDHLKDTVYVEFSVDTNGVTFNHKILKSTNKELDAEALRITKLIKFDKPAMQRGKPVVVKYLLPIIFKANN